MANKESFGGCLNLPALNEDNKYADVGKFKSLPYKKNDPENMMNCPPYWNVKVDGYGGQASLHWVWHHMKEPLEHASSVVYQRGL
jgi:hypothetical protein